MGQMARLVKGEPGFNIRKEGGFEQGLARTRGGVTID